MSGEEASSDYRDSGEQQLDRKNYPYFTDEQFITFIEDGIDIEKAHLSCKKLIDKRIANFSLNRYEASHLENDLKIVIYGKTGSGKSLTANVILGKKEFIANSSSNSVTNVSLDNTCTYKDRRITVVDTPGIHDTRSDNATVVKELARIAFLLRNGVHCFIICMSASETRFTEEVVEMLKHIKQEGKGNFFDYCMVAYTKAETELETCTLGEFLKQKKEHEDNRRFLENIKDRVVAVNNKCLVPAEALRNRDALIEMVDIVVGENRRNGKSVIFTNTVFKEANSLHEKIASVVQNNNFPPILVNATIEAIINIRSRRFTFDLFFEEVMRILKERQRSEERDNISDLFIDGTTRVQNLLCQIYDEIKEDVSFFKERIYRIGVAVVTGTAVITVAAAGGAAAPAAAAAGGAAALGAAAVGEAQLFVAWFNNLSAN